MALILFIMKLQVLFAGYAGFLALFENISRAAGMPSASARGCECLNFSYFYCFTLAFAGGGVSGTQSDKRTGPRLAPG